MSDDDNVTKLNVAFRKPPSDGDRTLRLVRKTCREECNHKYSFEGSPFHPGGSVHCVEAHYLIREGETEIECGLCGTKLDPMFVLRILAEKESTWEQRRRQYLDTMRRLEKRRRVKCDNCGKMTRIRT